MENSEEQTTTSMSDQPTNHGTDPENREGEDRRKNPTPMVSKYLFKGRRRWNRRLSDPKERYYVDRFGKKAWVAVITILVLCGLDAGFTMYHIDKGYTEANPLLDMLMGIPGDLCWIIIKYFITALGLLILLVHKNFTLARIATIVIVIMYCLLIFWHLSPFLFPSSFD